MKKISLTAAIILLLITSCSYRITSLKYPDDYVPKKNDLFYVLNKTILEVKITYDKMVVTQFENGVPTIENPVYSVKAVEINPLSITDEKEMYVARGKNIAHRFFLKENADFLFHPNGSLKSVSADFTDESPETLESIIATSAVTAKTVMTAGKGGEQFVSDLQLSISETYAKLKEAILNNDAAQTSMYQAELDHLYALLDGYRERNKTVEEHSEVTFRMLVDPDHYYTPGAGQKEITLSPDTDPLKPELPPVKLIIPDDARINTNRDIIFGEAFKTKSGTCRIPGIVYRIPSGNKIQVTTSYADIEVQLTELIIYFPQYGHYGYVPLASKLFTNRKTELVFDSLTGVLTAYKTESGSSAARISKSMEKNAATIMETMDYMRYDLAVKDLEHKQKIKELEKAIREVEDSPLEKLQREFDLLKLEQEMEDFADPEQSEVERLREELEILRLQQEIENLKGQ